MTKKQYITPSVEVAVINLVNTIVVTSDIPGGGPGDPSAKLNYFDMN